jgi:hypothetical protein
LVDEVDPRYVTVNTLHKVILVTTTTTTTTNNNNNNDCNYGTDDKGNNKTTMKFKKYI